MQKVMIISERDNVAVCLDQMKPGDTVEINIGSSNRQISLLEPVPFGHKVALFDIEKGDKVIKYGEVIGIASRPIKTGQHVHVHNVESIRARGDKQ